VSQTWKAALIPVAAFLAFAALAAGCGGDSESASTSTATTTVASGGERFTAAEWEKYQKDAAAYKKTNTTALAKVSVCAEPINPPPGAIEKCVGDTLDNLATATRQLDQDLKDFTGTASGACQTALSDLLGYITSYEASIQALQHTIDTNNGAAAYNSAAAMQETRSDAQAKNQAVVSACAPA